MTAAEVRRVRERLGLSQQALAEELGVARLTVYRWEAGRRRVPEMAARLLARLLEEAVCARETVRELD